jgi:general secretion pathway protein A
MFEGFYQLSHTPFSRDIPTDELYQSRSFSEALGRMEYTISQNYFTMVTGESGVGKTTLARKLKDSLDPKRHMVMYLAECKLTPRYFYRNLIGQLGGSYQPYRGEAKNYLHQELEIMHILNGIETVVIIDEAHLLEKEMLEELRFLLNHRMDSESPLALILLGQNELWNKLKLQAYTSIHQRVDLQCSLSPLDREQVGGYIRRHLTYAGTEHEIFSDAAIDLIFKYSNGLPRLINKACTHSLIYGAQKKRGIIDDHMVTAVIEGELS